MKGRGMVFAGNWTLHVDTVSLEMVRSQNLGCLRPTIPKTSRAGVCIS